MQSKISAFRFLSLLIILLLLPVAAFAQDPRVSLANLPEADVLIYLSPQKILNEAAPRLVPPAELAKMRASFADMKKSVGVDPSSVQYVVMAFRFHKPAGDLSFVAPDVMAVVGGDFNANSLFSLAELALQNQLRTEKHGSSVIGLVRVDPIAEQAAKMPMLKSLAEVGTVVLNENTLAIGNLGYLKSAIDAAAGTGRINPATLDSLMRDPNVLIAASGAPFASLARSIGLFGTEAAPRDGRCDTTFGNFYAAVTMSGTNLVVRGAMNADNPDTAKIITNLLAGLMQQGISAVPDKQAQSVLQSIKMTPTDNEIVWEADIPEQAIINLFKPAAKPSVVGPKAAPKRAPVRRKRTR